MDSDELLDLASRQLGFWAKGSGFYSFAIMRNGNAVIMIDLPEEATDDTCQKDTEVTHFTMRNRKDGITIDLHEEDTKVDYFGGNCVAGMVDYKGKEICEFSFFSANHEMEDIPDKMFKNGTLYIIIKKK